MASRVSTVVPAASRHSKSAGIGKSPFTAKRMATRIVAAKKMITQRQAEMKSLERALTKAATPKEERILLLRLQATQNNMKAWESYLTAPERETRAVIRPAA